MTWSTSSLGYVSLITAGFFKIGERFFHFDSGMTRFAPNVDDLIDVLTREPLKPWQEIIKLALRAAALTVDSLGLDFLERIVDRVIREPDSKSPPPHLFPYFFPCWSRWQTR